MRVCTCSMIVHRSETLARSGRADRKLRAQHAWLPAGPGGTPAVGGLVSLGSKRSETKLIAGWIFLPALQYRGACMVRCAHGCCACGVECVAGLLC